MTLRIITFGTLSVRSDRGIVAGAAAQPRRLAVLGLLARAGERGVTREKLTALIWPDADEERSRRAITQGIYALRQELGSDDAILGVKDLRLNPDLISSDVADFTSAIRAGRFEDAARVYAGPFFDGFHLSGNDEFDRWMDAERATLSHEHSEALEKLAAACQHRGDHTAALGWWRRLSAKDPLSARYAIGVMQSLMETGDKHGALEHARIHETLLEQQLDLPADRDVVALAAKIRRELRAAARAQAETHTAETSVAVVDAPAPSPRPETAARPEPVPEPPPVHRTVEARVKPEPPTSPDVPPGGRPRRWRAVAVAALGITALGIAAVAVRARRVTTARDTTPVVAVGLISDFSLSGDRRIGLPIAELLSTNLARVRGLRVVSSARMLELIRQASPSNDTSAAAVLAAARLAGATELVDGTVYARPDGRLRLDLRRVGLTTGDIIEAETVEGADVFALVDSGTARLVAAHGSAPPGSVAGVTTRSVAAYSLYAQGLRSYADGDVAGARRLFAAALREDSLFAMAAYQYARTASGRAELGTWLARALRFSQNATDRERLMIRAGWAWSVTAPELGALADSLVARYPQETQGHLYAGIARVVAGDFLGAVAPLQRVVAMDSISFVRADSINGCDACLAMFQLVVAYELADSLGAAEREARRWTRLAPESARAWSNLWDVLERQGRFTEAEQVAARAAQFDPDPVAATERTALHAIRLGNFDAADRVLRAAIQGGGVAVQQIAYWNLIISLRYQGRANEAVEAARKYRELVDRAQNVRPGEPTLNVRPLAQTYAEAGRYRDAAALFDSTANWRSPDESASSQARERAWSLAHAARSLAAGGDTASLAARADTIESVAAMSGGARDRGLASYIRGLLLIARNDLPDAADSIRKSIYSVPAGYTRENCDLAQALLRLARPQEAIALLQPIMRSKLDASNYYVTQTEVHELLAKAWSMAGRADSAAMHYERVARAWERGDPPYAQRAAAARAAIASFRAKRGIAILLKEKVGIPSVPRNDSYASIRSIAAST